MTIRAVPTELDLLEADGEAAVVGAVMSDPRDWPELSEVVYADDFAREQHRVIWSALGRMADRREAVDMATLTAELQKAGDLERSGGVGYLSVLGTLVPVTPNAALRHARLVHDRATRRRLGVAAAVIARLAADDTVPLTDALDAAEREVLAVARDPSADAKTDRIDAALSRVFKSLEQRFERREAVTGLRTGLTDLDEMTSGLHPGQLFIVAARPGNGKTAIAMGMAAIAARTANVAVFSLEMSEDSLVERLMSHEGGVDGIRMRNGQFVDSDWPRLAKACERLQASRMVVDDTPALTVQQIRARCRRIVARHGPLALVVVDYIQMMRVSREDGNDRRDLEISRITKGLKSLAKELACPVVALSQLNRAMERRPDKRPMMSDLRDGGSIEEDADTIAFLYFDEYYNPKTENKGIVEIIIGKQRNGPTGTIPVTFVRPFTRFEDIDRDTAREWRERRNG